MIERGDIFYVCARCGKKHTEFAGVKRHILSHQPIRSNIVCVDKDACLQRIANKRLGQDVNQLGLFPTADYMTVGALLG